MTTHRITQLSNRIDKVNPTQVFGKITRVEETMLHGLLPGAATGALVYISNAATRTLAQVVAVDGVNIKMLPLMPLSSVAVGDCCTIHKNIPTIPVSFKLLGRVINPMGQPMDELGPIADTISWPLHRAAPHPLQRPDVNSRLHTGIKALDSLLTLGRGARFGLFAGPGQGKSTLLGNLARHTDCDVTIICLAGERGREAGEFVNRILGADGLARSIVVLSTSDTPAAQRVMSAQTATAIAEWFRDQGKNVLLLVDSLTRIVRSKRDMDLSAGIPLGPNGLSTTTLSFLPPLLERAAPNQQGSISAMYTVLEQTNDDKTIASEITSLLDGHILLSKKKADAGKWPAIDVVKSISRVMNQVVPPKEQLLAGSLRRVLAAYDENEELILIGAYNQGSCKYTDSYLACRKEIDEFLCQRHFPASHKDTMEQLQKLTEKFRKD